MIDKRILPESFGFDVPAVDIIDTYSKGLNKTAMLKRASAFEDVIEELAPEKGKTYLHVITTGAMETYSGNRNGDAFNESECDHECTHPETPDVRVLHLDGGLKKYHDKSYMDGKAAVYQEHHSDEEPSGKIVAARYNEPMHRGELIIAVDTEKWAPRLQRKASGQDIFLSMGCSVPFDVCTACHHKAHTMSEHCEHFKHQRTSTLDDGSQCFVINDAPHFYDISGVDVPADRIAFVLRKVASGAQVKTASAEARYTLSSRIPMPFNKAAAMLNKLSRMEKQIECCIEGDKTGDDDEAFKDDEDMQRKFILRVENYPADEIIDGCNRKGMLLSPGMLFKLLGAECEDDEDRGRLEECDDSCCGDCSCMLREMSEDDDGREELMDGSFDQHFPVDISLDSILESFMPDLCMSNPAVGSRAIRIVIMGRPERRDGQRKEASFRKRASDALRRTYARYFISFASQNDDATVMNALRKVARYGK